jgi:sodium-coupled neutral amino acid transporter 10
MTFKFIVTMANSIIGVSILAMPFCFKQCGILLATLMLLASSLVVKMACHLLLKSAILARSRTYEFLAFHTFGSPGKLAVEVIDTNGMSSIGGLSRFF